MIIDIDRDVSIWPDPMANAASMAKTVMDCIF